MSATRGELLHGRYELIDLIATGGMGEVWRATDTRLNRDVAVKLLKPELAAQKGFLDRFRIEARNAALLTHPNVCAVYDYGETDAITDGPPPAAYLVMELVPGEPLSSIITRESPLAPDRVLDYLRQAAAGLGAAHAAGVVHRDVKPGNLLVTPEGVVKITDFGVARASGQSNLTATGQVMGTAQYLAPEQALGEVVTPAADVYAVGVVGYQALTGAVPFVRESQVATALAQVNDDPPPLPDSVPPAVRDLIMGLLRKEPSARPANGRDLAAAIMAVESGYQPHLPAAAATTAVPATTQPTEVLRRGSTTGRPAARTAVPAAPPKRSGVRLPLIFLLGLLALLGLWAAYNSLAQDDPTPTPNVTVTQTQTSTITTTITPNTTSPSMTTEQPSTTTTDEPQPTQTTSPVQPTQEPTQQPTQQDPPANTTTEGAPTADQPEPSASVSIPTGAGSASASRPASSVTPAGGEVSAPAITVPTPGRTAEADLTPVEGSR